MMRFHFKRSELSRAILKFRHEFFWVAIFSMVANLLMLSPTIYMLQIYDRILVSKSELTLLFLTLIVILFFWMTAYAEWLRSRLLVRASVKFDQALNTRVFNSSFKDYLGQTQQDPAEAFTLLTKMRQFITGNGVIAMLDAPWAPIYIAIIFMLSPILGYFAILFALIQLLLAYVGHRVTHVSMESALNAQEKNKTHLYHKLRNAETVEAMGMLANLRTHWLVLHKAHQIKSAHTLNKQYRQQSITKFARYCMQSLTLGAAALLVIKGEITAGSMIAANVLMARALQPLDLIVGSWGGFIQTKAAFKKLESLLRDNPEEMAEVLHDTPKGEVSLQDLTATSPNRTTPILDRMSIDFKAGQVTVIIGPSGSGKSTLARCLVGVWPHTEGRVLLDMELLSGWDQEHLGPHIGYLPQDVELLDGTIAENIGRFEEMNSEKIIEAARRVGMHEMILRLPLGYNTQIGESGSVLSGGQRQRIALARAMYGNPELIVLDEPNANLDDLGERAMLQAIRELKEQGKTLFLISHRLDVLSVADYLLVLKEGRVEHYGPRDGVLSTLRTQANHGAVP